MLDFDLAAIYATETRILKQSVKRNIARLPKDFMFTYLKKNGKSLSQIVTTSLTH
jgi:ORF6N domain